VKDALTENDKAAKAAKELLDAEMKGVKDSITLTKEEAGKAAKELIDAEMKTVKEDLAKAEKKSEGIDWDKLRQKADAPAPAPVPAPAPAAAPEVTPAPSAPTVPEETGKLVD
jgi:hypothetical protein